jgi:tetratricopeptide (TPR) repeat protein/CHAT domain-containing protein
MDEERFQEYCNFIYKLLSLSDKETIITHSKENCHLIDKELVLVMKAAAKGLIKQGFSENAQRLLNFAKQLGELIAAWEYMTQIAIQIYHQGKYTEAIKYAEQALDLAKNIWIDDNPCVATSLDNLGLFLHKQGRLKEAELHHRNALAIYQRLCIGDHRGLATNLNNLGYLLESQGRYREAESYHRDALAIYQRLFKCDDPHIAQSLSNLSVCLLEQERLTEAESYCYEALAMRRRLFKNDHPDVAESLANIAALLVIHEKYKEAESYYRDALTMFRRLLGDEHPHVIQILDYLGQCFKKQRKYKEAEHYYRNALAIKQKLYQGQDHFDVVNSFYHLAKLLEAQARYKEAEFYYRNILEIRQRLFEGDHPDVAQSINDLGLFLKVQGKYQEAESYYRDALAMRQKLFKNDHLDIAQSLSNLGLLLQIRGKLTEAEPYFYNTLTMYQRLFQGDHPYIVVSLNNLGFFLQAQGKYEEAEFYYKKALAMGKNVLEGDDPGVAQILDNLAVLLTDEEKYEEAESYFSKSLAIRHRFFAGDHPDVAQSINNWGTFLLKQEKLTEAESNLRDALAMYQKLFPDDHPDLAGILNNLGLCLQKQEKLTEAELHLRNALAMYQKLFQGDHPRLAINLNNLALLLAVTHSHEEALEKFLEAVTVENKITSRVFAFSSETDRLHHLKQIRTTTNVLLSLVVAHLQDNSEAIKTSFDVIIQRKSLSAAAVSAFNAAIYEERYQHLTEQLQQWRSLGEQIVYLTFNQDKPEDRKLLAQLTQEADRLEKYLASQVPEIQLKDQTINRKNVAEKLPSGSALLEFVHFGIYDFNNSRWSSSCYLAFILPAGQPDKLEMKVLGEAEEIEQLIELSRFLAIAYIRNADGQLQLARFDGEQLADFKRMSQIPPKVEIPPRVEPEKIPYYPYIPTAAIQLCQKIFDPIREYLGDCQQIFIAPDASLSLVPFGLLPLDETGKELLGDRYKISYLSAARDLFRSTVTTNRPASSPKIIADPKFLLDELDTNAIASKKVQREREKENKSSAAVATLDSQLISVLDEESLSRAETTGLLAQKVATMLEVEPHLQEDALVTHLNNNQCPSILLIGTHGLYCPLTESEQLPLSSLSSDRLSSLPQLPNPMVRSGLAFAGASNWQKNLPLPPEAGKGFLLAQDVAQLDLWANEITILLACNSAVGDVHQGEGVFGLRRAFAVAGAKTLVMSLWSVPEKASALLMERFFNNLRDRNMGRGAALQEAQNYIRYITVKELRQTDLGLEVLKELTGDRNFDRETPVEDENYQPLTHPFYWGAWICQGETTDI